MQKAGKITKISVPHTETYKVGATNVTEGVTVVQFVHVACELGADYICEKAIGCSL
ncbi:MAG: hypothetical protein AMDU3_IPLC00005G0002 [Thermoplasmatales archaeon I-plasma]|nr:MAG: hypothetical protein AMDU3_IPLC00005G0002 [Thermoplasmatales archaeon I-plasma]